MTSGDLLKWLDICLPVEDTGGSCDDCPYIDRCPHIEKIEAPCEWLEDVRAYLKAQEPVEPYIKTSRSGTSWWYSCGNCNRAIDPNDKYCRNCGRAVKAVKWE